MTAIRTYNTQPQTRTAVLFTGFNAFDIFEFIGRPDLISNPEIHETDSPSIPTINGDVILNPGDYVMPEKGVTGKFYPVNGKQFLKYFSIPAIEYDGSLHSKIMQTFNDIQVTHTKTGSPEVMVEAISFSEMVDQVGSLIGVDPVAGTGNFEYHSMPCSFEGPNKIAVNTTNPGSGAPLALSFPSGYVLVRFRDRTIKIMEQAIFDVSFTAYGS